MRDRGGSFDPQTIPKGQTRFDGFDEILDVRARVAQFRPAVDARMSVEAPPCWASAPSKGALTKIIGQVLGDKPSFHLGAPPMPHQTNSVGRAG